MAMGSLLSPIVTDLFMEDFDDRALMNVSFITILLLEIHQ